MYRLECRMPAHSWNIRALAGTPILEGVDLEEVNLKQALLPVYCLLPVESQNKYFLLNRHLWS